MYDKQDILKKLGLSDVNSGVYAGEWLQNPSGDVVESISPIDGQPIAKVRTAGKEDYDQVVDRLGDAFKQWRLIPAPKRGEIVRLLGLELRKHKQDLGKLVTLEMGKILPEGEGEVQEMIDMADFSVGLSRQLYGLTIQSERPGHRLYEQWQPLGTIGIITAFNFPVAVWAWNATVAAVAGDSMVWKPSTYVPLTAIAVMKIVDKVLKDAGAPPVMGLVTGPGRVTGEAMLTDKRLPMVSFTGSVAMGRRVSEKVATRMGRTILELGGNNAIIMAEDADMALALRAVLFAAVGTAGQRCTTLRRLIIHESIKDKFVPMLINAYKQVRIGNPLEPGIMMGPMIDKMAVAMMMNAIERAKQQGGTLLYGGRQLTGQDYPGGCYVEPAIIEAKPDMPIVQEETFAPLLYVIPYKDLDEAIAIHNSVPQGLSSAIFTNDLRKAEQFLGPAGSDCGIANVNIGTSGAEIGGAFGGEKETGGGREAGSDAWKAYMRRQTVTINYSRDLPLAQGIKFGE